MLLVDGVDGSEGALLRRYRIPKDTRVSIHPTHPVEIRHSEQLGRIRFDSAGPILCLVGVKLAAEVKVSVLVDVGFLKRRRVRAAVVEAPNYAPMGVGRPLRIVDNDDIFVPRQHVREETLAAASLVDNLILAIPASFVAIVLRSLVGVPVEPFIGRWVTV